MALPNAPTALTPVNGAVIFSLTPTFTGVHSDPDGDALSSVLLEVRRVSDDSTIWGVTRPYGGSGPGWSIAYTGPSLVSREQVKWRARTVSANEPNSPGAWSDFLTLLPVINAAPIATVVSPTGNPTLGTLTPTFQGSYSDPDGDAQAAYQVQVRDHATGAIVWDTGKKAGAVTSWVYAGSTLTSGTQYDWRWRPWDSWDEPGEYTGWASFTPRAAPNPPTLTSPSGLTNTLTPTIQGAYSAGLGGTEAAFQYEVRQGVTTIYRSGDVATAIATGQAYGTNNPSDTPSTPPALAWGTSYQIRAQSKDNLGSYSEWSAWQAFWTNAAPTAPSNLSPNGSVIGDTTPRLSWQHNDPDGDAQTAADVELRKVSDDSVVTGYGPKVLSQSTTTHDVTETLTASPATQYKYRVRTKGTAGPGYGPWSDWTLFTVAEVPTVTVTEPDPGDVITTPGFTVTWTFSGGSGTQQDYRVRAYGEDGLSAEYDSGVTAGTELSHDVPPGAVSNGGQRYVRVTARDTLNQEADSGLVPFETDWTPPAAVTGGRAVAVGSQA